MDRTFYFNHQLVDDGDLNNTETTKKNQIIYRFQSLFGNSGGYGKGYGFYTGSVPDGGVFGSPADYSITTTNLYVSALNTTSLSIATGSAVDSNGELIRVLSPLTCNVGGSSVNYTWPGSPNVLNYVKLKYIESSGSLRSDLEGLNSYYTRYTGSYYVTINNTLPSSNEILLATFIGDSNGWISGSSIQDRRTYIRPITPADAVYLDPSVKPISTHYTVEDHVKAVGTGTPTTTNPHGLSNEDLTGFGVSSHIKLQHRNGIMLNDTSSSAQNSWQPTLGGTNGVDPYLIFTAPYAASASIAGKIYSGTVANLHSSSAPGDGNYYAVIDSSGNASFISSLANTKNFTYLPLAYVTISGSKTTISSIQDVRPFYGLSMDDIRFNITENTSAPSLSSSPFWTINDNLARIRYQLGMSIDKNGNDWNLASPPLTAGTGSVGDAYHTHNHDQLLDIRGTTASSTNLRTLTAGTTSNADPLHTHPGITNTIPSYLPMNRIINFSPPASLNNYFYYWHNTTGAPVMVLSRLTTSDGNNLSSLQLGITAASGSLPNVATQPYMSHTAPFGAAHFGQRIDSALSIIVPANYWCYIYGHTYPSEATFMVYTMGL